MTWPTIHRVLLVAALTSAWGAGLSQAGELRAWGLDRDGQVTGVPEGDDYVAVAAGDAHGLALRSGGGIVAWGQNDDGECDVPEGVYMAVGAGADFSLAIRADGSIAAWGADGQRQISNVPAGNDFVAVDGGEFFAVALRADGSIVAWGNDRWGQVSNAPSGAGFKAVVAGDDHGLALRADGSLVSWGYWGAAERIPTSGVFTAVGAGGDFGVALSDDGILSLWGDVPDGYGLARVPDGSNYVAVSAGYLHGLALKQDGSAVGWGAGADASGHPNWGQAAPPAGNDYAALAGGLYFSVALTADRSDPIDQPVRADDFNDNRLDDSWTLVGEDLPLCSLEEANQRLELVASSQAPGASVSCLGEGWQIDPKGDFSFRVDCHYSLVSDNNGAVFIGIVPDVNDELTRHVKLGIGCDRQSPYLWYELIDGRDGQLDYAARRENDGVLYVSYDATLDELYLGTEGYGSEAAWAVLPGLLQGSWRGASISVLLGGAANGLDVVSGDAWLDSFLVEKAILTESSTGQIGEVYRFWSPVTSRHFYTIDPAERDALLREFSHVWTYEGPVFRAALSAFDPKLQPVYRFWSAASQSHFYTIDEAEKDELIAESPDLWIFEGAVFYAYPKGAQPADSVPVYRLWNAVDSTHFYTVDPAEKDALVREYPKVYVAEGEAFYALKL